MTRDVAREISYSWSAHSKAGRAVIRTMENTTGRIGLIKRARGYDDDVAGGDDFWAVMMRRYGLSLDVVGGNLENLPVSGPLVVIANHPYGILDGMVMGYILSALRRDFRILANSVFHKSTDLQRVILPISFDETREALEQNIQTRKSALRYLADGGAVGVFPGGTVSTASRPMGHPMDPSWRLFTAKMIAKSSARVVPIYFDGHTSRLFQVASHVHPTLRMGLLVKEFKRRVDRPVRICIGQPLEACEIDSRRSDPRAMMDFLRKSTYALAPKPVDVEKLGYEFEEKHRA